MVSPDTVLLVRNGVSRFILPLIRQEYPKTEKGDDIQSRPGVPGFGGRWKEVSTCGTWPITNSHNA